jgi:glycosyltransferase involved in cell wall biosynthesis
MRPQSSFASGATDQPERPGGAPTPETVVLMTTWNRPTLLRQSLPQIEREARSIDARLVIADDQSDDEHTLALLDAARRRGADLIRRDYVRAPYAAKDSYVHNPAKVALRRLLSSPVGGRLVRAHISQLVTPNQLPGASTALQELWNSALHAAHVNAQHNNLFGFRYLLAAYPNAARILKIDDDVVLANGAFQRMVSAWRDAEQDGHDVLALSGIRTVNEAAITRFPTYVLTRGICNVAVLYRSTDWEAFLRLMPTDVVIRDGFDLTFACRYSPLYRPGAVAISVFPSAVYHAGFNGMHVRNSDLNCDYDGPTASIIVQ